MNARNMDRCDISNRLREANDAYPAQLITWDEKLIEERKLTGEPIRRRQARLWQVREINRQSRLHIAVSHCLS